MLSNVSRLFFVPLALLSLTLGGCLTTSTTRGYNIDRMTKQKQAVVVGQTTEAEVKRLLGSPSTESSFGDKTWYYVASKTESVAFLKPKIIDQRVLVVAFDDTGTVNRIHEYTREDAMVLTFNKDHTHTEGNDLTVLQQLLGNVGRFNPDSLPGGKGPRMPRGGVDYP